MNNPYRLAAIVMAFIVYGLAGVAFVLMLIVGIHSGEKLQWLMALPALVAGAFAGTMMLVVGEIVRLLDDGNHEAYKSRVWMNRPSSPRAAIDAKMETPDFRGVSD